MNTHIAVSASPKAEFMSKMNTLNDFIQVSIIGTLSLMAFAALISLLIRKM
jgi:hypothetical protein